MQLNTLLWRNLAYHWRTNAAVVAGVATAVAVMAGALLVGESVRGSLRDLVIGRLGKTDLVIAGTNPFRAQLAADLASHRGLSLEAYPMLAMEGIVAHDTSGRVASKVQIYGVDDGFWKFHQTRLAREAPTGRNALVSPSLASELAIQKDDTIVVRLDKPSDIPVDSLHGRKEETVRAMRLGAAATLPTEELGEFSLRPAQSGVRAVFVALSRLQRELGQQGKANMILLGSHKPTDAAAVEKLLRERATLADLGVRVRTLSAQKQFAVDTSSMVISDSLAAAASEAAKELGWRAAPVLSYLVNAMKLGDKEIPYSLVAALDPSLIDTRGGIVLNDWTARDLGAKPGDKLHLDFYRWLDEGRLATEGADLQVTAITPISGPAADRDYAPEYPGITEAGSISEWDPPFPMNLGRITKHDEDYWDKYRTTPKAFVPLAQAAKWWGTRYGKFTSLRLTGPLDGDLDVPRIQYEMLLRRKLQPAQMGLTVFAIRQESLAASTGSTDFGEYFFYFSFFLLVSALLLVGLFFRLNLEQRHREAGLLRALGYSVQSLTKLYLQEGVLLACGGAIIGMLFAAAYASLILYGLRTWWVDAVGTQLLRLHASPVALIGGALGGLITAALVIWATARALRKMSPRGLLQGQTDIAAAAHTKSRARWVAILCAVVGLTLLAAAASGSMSAAGGFFGAGALLLIAALAAQRMWLNAGVVTPQTIWRLGWRNAAYKPGRSVLSMALIAFAAFLILALSSFRQEGGSTDPAQWPGTGGYALVGEAALPIIHNPGTPEGRQELGFPTDAEIFFQNVKLVPLRLRPGDDASCLNLYAPKNPRVLALPDPVLFQMPLSKEKLAPRWGEIAAYVDANSLQYVLHKEVGDTIVLNPDSGKPIILRISATIHDSVFQSEIIIREADFLKAFPEQPGFRMFLAAAPETKLPALTTMIEERLKDYGVDMQGTVERLAGYHRVENAYISTFQALGGFGLLLGTVGLAAVLLRNVLERRKELALLRAVGFQPQQIATMVLAENIYLLASGLLTGALCAALAVMPALTARGAHLPMLSMASLLLLVAITGLLASILAVKAAMKTPLLSSLRSE
ncbi:MAG: ABC transporter permease [Acidobacteria bacterium]|nr:ABC transporter permease [Acidobacteriota bacterium]